MAENNVTKIVVCGLTLDAPADAYEALLRSCSVGDRADRLLATALDQLGVLARSAQRAACGPQVIARALRLAHEHDGARTAYDAAAARVRAAELEAEAAAANLHRVELELELARGRR